MPITRRKRANPPDQPENNNHLADQPQGTAEVVPSEQTQQAPETPTEAAPTLPSAVAHLENGSNQAELSVTQTSAVNGEHVERQEAAPAPLAPLPIEGGRRTARGELFRRPPQPPVPTMAQPQPVPAPAVPLQAPSHEITLPLGKRPGDAHGDQLHLAYNPGYTGAEEVRSVLLHQLAQESKAGGRARCWSCGSISIVYDRWSTRNKTLGEIGVAICEICGVWSVM